MMKKLNVYFFDEEEISSSDAIWFYGGFGAMFTILFAVVANFLA